MKTALGVPCAIVLSFALGMMLPSARGWRAQKDAQRVTGVGGVFFKAQNTAELASWYRDHLGIALEPAGKAGPQYHVFAWREKEHADTVGSTVFSIFPASSKYFDPGTAPFMINFRVANLARLLAQLKAEGVRVDEKIDDEPNGRFGWVMDPEGHRIELWEPKGE
jgi:catechol 2,3-dioxygenase-like lactoylglutathione lyase family enzyme